MVVTAAQAGLLVCRTCGLLNRKPARAGTGCVCARCRSRLHLRKPDSLNRSWAFLITAFILYIPANTLPVLKTGSLLGNREDTILSGAMHLWATGWWPLALIIVVASFLVPVSKLLLMTYLLATVQKDVSRDRQGRARLYRGVEFIGRWSMVDVFVAAILVSLMQFHAIATVHAGPGAVAFGGVVVLTMLASRSFDPRLIWDIPEPSTEDAAGRSAPGPYVPPDANAAGNAHG
jgi:paraquat-inducible protein A